MSSTFTQNLLLEKPGTGEQAGVWGVTANASYDTLDTAINGNAAIAMSASTVTLTTQQGGGPSQGAAKLITWTGTLTQQGTVNVAPNTAQKLYLMQNQTGGSFALTFRQGSGASFTLQPGYSAWVACDGAGGGAGVTPALDNPQFTNVLIQGTLTCSSPQAFNQPVGFNQLVSFNGPAAMTEVSIATPGYTAAANDLFFRNSVGYVAPLAVGTPGQVLTVGPGPVLEWATVGASVGEIITGSVANAIYFSSAANVLAQDAYVVIKAGVGIGIGLLPTYALHLGVGRNPEICLDLTNPAGQTRQLLFATNSLPRWQLYAPMQAESGGNAGSNLQLLAYTDPATASRSVISFTRANGNVTIGAPGGDQSAQLAVLNNTPGQAAMVVRGATGQTAVLQSWQNSGGAEVAHIDNAGSLWLASSQFLQLTSPAGRLDLHGTVPGHPLGSVHIGPEPGTGFGLCGSLLLEQASGSVDNLPANCVRMYYRNQYFTIQFTYSGQQYFLTAYLVGPTGPLTWEVTTVPVA